MNLGKPSHAYHANAELCFNQVISLFMNQLESIESYGEIEELNIASNK